MIWATAGMPAMGRKRSPDMRARIAPLFQASALEPYTRLFQRRVGFSFCPGESLHIILLPSLGGVQFPSPGAVKATRRRSAESLAHIVLCFAIALTTGNLNSGRRHDFIALIADDDAAQSCPCLDMESRRQLGLRAPGAVLDPRQRSGLPAIGTGQRAGGHGRIDHLASCSMAALTASLTASLGPVTGPPCRTAQSRHFPSGSSEDQA